METKLLIKNILLELGVGESDVQPNRLLKRDLQLDSTDTVQIALEIKKRLNVAVRIESSQDLTVAQLCELVDGQKTQSVERISQ
ncbi:MAG TPA: acyl carrier protein [Polyangiaceae bacterium]|nr:acyl carrier protein [Polyangiaceae bacterium]